MCRELVLTSGIVNAWAWLRHLFAHTGARQQLGVWHLDKPSHAMVLAYEISRNY
jgi:hypothetical protein